MMPDDEEDFDAPPPLSSTVAPADRVEGDGDLDPSREGCDPRVIDAVAVLEPRR